MFKENDGIESHLEKIDSMKKRADRTHETLSYLLSQKQKRASYEGALTSVLYARQRAKIAVDYPLTFMAAFFAINIGVFPTNSDGKLELGYVLKYM
ncbi:hypothetical protein PG999_007855, partial [Apiospora kogelbergensis]